MIVNPKIKKIFNISRLKTVEIEDVQTPLSESCKRKVQQKFGRILSLIPDEERGMKGQDGPSMVP